MKVYFLLFLYVMSFAYTNCNRCPTHIDNAVDITEGEKQNDTIVFENIAYTKGHYFHFNGRIYGCVCTFRKCLNKCCPRNTSYVRGWCEYVEGVPEITVYRGLEKSNLTMRNYYLFKSKLCQGPKFQLSEEFEYYIQEDGHIITFSWIGNLTDNTMYCFDGDENSKITIMVCVTPEMEEADEIIVKPTDIDEMEKDDRPYMIFSAMICFLAMWTNYIIIRTILKNKSMRTPTNAYISNWAIYDLLYLIMVPINFLLKKFVTDEKVVCVFKDIEGTLELATIILITMFLFDYLINNSHKRFLAISWALIIILTIASIINCIVGDAKVQFIEKFSGAVYGVLLVIFVTKLVIYNIRPEQQNDSNYRLRLAVAFTYVFCWVFRWIFWYVHEAVEDKDDKELFAGLSEHANIIGFINSVFNVFVLTLLNKQFYTNMFKMLGCRAELSLASDNDRATQLSQP